MKAVVVDRCGETVWREVPDVPGPGAYQAIARVRAFTICNSTDRHLRDCDYGGATQDDCPFVLGHESVGEVVAVGPKCRHLREGDLVFRPMAVVEGYGSFWGGFAEYGPVADRRAYEEDGSPAGGPRVLKGHQVVAPGISPAHAVVLITLKEVMTYLGNIGAGEGSRLLVTGHGPVGLAAADLGRRLLGCERIVVAGRRPEAEAQVLDFGADAWVDTREPDWAARAVELLGGPAGSIYETTGNPEVAAEALKALADDGVFGPYAARPASAVGEMPTDPRMIGAGTDEGLSHDRICAATLDGTIEPECFITHRLAPERIAEGFDLIERRLALKVVFEV